jgi:sialate O-acetylesterase
MMMNRPFACAVLLSLPLLGSIAQAELQLPAVFSDGMVLQREATVPFWGRAEAGGEVSVRGEWMAAPVGCRVGEDGRWRVEIPTPEAGGPFSIEIIGETTLLLEDVLIGEVWLCSGQSNMEWKIAWTAEMFADFEKERAKHDRPLLRVFDVANTFSMTPLDDCTGRWRSCTPEAWPDFSAVAFYFGRKLQEELGVPIGLITSDWGGTPAEAWTSRPGLGTMVDFADLLKRVDEALVTGGETGTVERKQAGWWRKVEETDPGSVEGWHVAEIDVSPETTPWKAMAQPGIWNADSGLDDFEGVVWFRRTVEIPEEWAGQALILELGAIDDMDTTWFAGERVGGCEGAGLWQTPRVYEIPASLVHAGSSSIAVRAIDTGGAGGFSSEPETLRLRLADDEQAAPLSLAGPWLHRVGASMAELGAWPTAGWFHSRSPMALFNGMIAPLVPYRIRGAIWYQGEANRSRAAQYRTLFPAMITDWREHWGQGDFPFYFVQIAPYNYGGDSGEAAELREAQTFTLSLPNTGMAVTMDIGNPADIHPRNKWEVGRRLSLWALARTYGREGLVWSGPLYRDMAIEGDRIRLHFTNRAGWLSTEEEPLAYFTIAGEDRVFQAAEARIDGASIVVWSGGIEKPVAVRFAWGATDEPGLFNGVGLPAPSFRTDDWVR